MSRERDEHGRFLEGGGLYYGKTIGVRLKGADDALFSDLADRRGLKRGELARHVIEDWLEEQRANTTSGGEDSPAG